MAHRKGLRLGLGSAPFPTCCMPMGADWMSSSLQEHLPWTWKALSPGTSGAHPPTFGLFATKAAGVILPPTLRGCSTALDPRLGLLVPVSSWNLLVHMVGQVPHDAHAVLYRLWEEMA